MCSIWPSLGKPLPNGGKQTSDKEGNIRDYANVSQLVCLANLENRNAVWIEEGLAQSDRLRRLNQVAIQQMQMLTRTVTAQRLQGGNQGNP